MKLSLFWVVLYGPSKLRGIINNQCVFWSVTAGDLSPFVTRMTHAGTAYDTGNIKFYMSIWYTVCSITSTYWHPDPDFDHIMQFLFKSMRYCSDNNSGKIGNEMILTVQWYALIKKSLVVILVMINHDSRVTLIILSEGHRLFALRSVPRVKSH